MTFLLFFASFRETGADMSKLWPASCSLESSPVDFFSACRAFRRFSYVPNLLTMADLQITLDGEQIQEAV